MKGIRIIWKSHSSEIKKGYLRLSIRDSELGKTKIVSLNLPPISERHFDKVKQKVKSSFKDFEKYNSVIEKVIKEYEIRQSPIFIKDEKKTLNYFVENMLIPNCKSQGTREKYRNILNLLTLFHNVFKVARHKDCDHWKEGDRDKTKLAWLLAPESAYTMAKQYKTNMQDSTCNWLTACAARK